MKLRLTPQRDDAIIKYEVEGDVLTVIVNEEKDTFDFAQTGNGEYSDFTSELLPFCPVRSATKTAGDIVVTVLNTYGPEPIQGAEESTAGFAARYAEWEKQLTEYEVEL